MELSDYLRALVRGWWLIVVFALRRARGGAAAAHAQRPRLESASYWVSNSSFGSAPPAPSGGSNLFGGGISPDQILYYASSDAVMAGPQPDPRASTSPLTWCVARSP